MIYLVIVLIIGIILNFVADYFTDKQNKAQTFVNDVETSYYQR